MTTVNSASDSDDDWPKPRRRPDVDGPVKPGHDEKNKGSMTIVCGDASRLPFFAAVEPWRDNSFFLVMARLDRAIHDFRRLSVSIKTAETP
jgi:hypothetical protein